MALLTVAFICIAGLVTAAAGSPLIINGGTFSTEVHSHKGSTTRTKGHGLKQNLLTDKQDFDGCPIFCPLNYDPVCASDGNTYSNACALDGERQCNNKPSLVIVCSGLCTGSGLC